MAKAEPVAKPRTFKRTAQRRRAATRAFARRAAPKPTFARRQNPSVIASADDNAVAQSDSRLGFQPETPVERPDSPWLGRPLGAADPSSYALVSADGETAADEKTDTAPEPVAEDTVQVADAGEINEIDLAATESPTPTNKSWLNALLAVLGGAFAAAASARFLLG